MAKTTQKTGNKSVKKINNIKESQALKWINLAFNTSFTVGKIVGCGGSSTYLIATGLQQMNVVMLALGAVLGAYGIVVLVSTSYAATNANV